MYIDPEHELDDNMHSRWYQAKEEELLSLIVKHWAWDAVKNTDDTKANTCKWVVKEKPDQLKARLIARGFSQQQWIDFEETFASVHNSIHNLSLLAFSLSTL